jgi:ribonuclease-3
MELEDQFGIKISDEDAEDRPSARPSTTSRRTSNPARSDEERAAALRRLIDELDPERASQLRASVVDPDRESSYERLEFLGDSVLGFSVATALYDAYPELSEGYLSRIRADVVSRRSCAHVARVLGLDTMLAERVPEGATLAASTNVAAAVLEAMLGVLFLELGIEAVREPIAEAFFEIAEESLATGPTARPSCRSCSHAAASRRRTRCSTRKGPARSPFRCAVVIDGEVSGVGEGRSKKDAEQIAATEALQLLADE